MAVGLVGREDELGVLEEALSAPDAAVVVHGEAGIGKTAVVLAAAAEGARTAGALASLSWMSLLPLRRAFTELDRLTWAGDHEHVATRVHAALGDATLVLDDLQWADDETLAVIDLLAGHARLVATVRQGDAGAGRTMERLAGLGFTRLDLAPLSVQAAGELVRSLRPGLGSAAVDDLVGRAGGNPLFLEELVRAGGAPDTLKLALGTRLDALGPAARSGLLLLAAADRPVGVGELPDADELRDAGLVEMGDGWVVTRHRLLAETVLALASADDVRAAHARLARIATSTGERARHLLAAGDTGAAYDAALAAAEESTSAAERFAHLRTAVECAPGAPGDDLVLAAARAANQMGDPGEARRLLEGLSDAARARCDVLTEWGTAAFELGDVDTWEKAVVEGIATAGTAAERVHFGGEEAAVAYFVHANPDRAVEIAAAVVEEGASAGVPHSVALRMLGTAQYLLGRREWPESMGRAIEQGRREEDVAGTFAALNNLISGHESAGDPAVGMRLADDAAAEAAGLRLTRWERHFLTRRLSLALHAGDHDGVERIAGELLGQPVMPRTREEVAAALASSRAERGRTDEALDLAERYLREATVRPSDYHAVRAMAFLAEDRGRAALRERAAFHRADPVSSMVTLMEPVFAWAAHQAGQPLPSYDGELLDWGMLAGVGPELEGIRALGDGDPGRAATLFADATERYEPFHHRGATRCAWAHGHALALAGHAERAASALARADERARAAGLAPLRRWIAQSARPGVAGPGVGQRPDGRLSAREAQVVRLVGEGLGDAEIARRLGVSTRTVQAQLLSARQKLGARSRLHAAELFADGR